VLAPWQIDKGATDNRVFTVGISACLSGALSRTAIRSCADADTHSDNDAYANYHANANGDVHTHSYTDRDGNSNYDDDPHTETRRTNTHTYSDAETKLEKLPAKGEQRWLKLFTGS